MNKWKRMYALMTAMAVMIVAMLPAQIIQAASNYIIVTKTVTPTTMTTADEAEVTLSIQGTPPVSIVIPNDVVLIIDKSGSMGTRGNPDHEDKMTAAKNAAKGFIDMMDMTKHKVGVVDFSSVDKVDSFDLTSDAISAKSYIDNIVENGSTDTGKAVYQAANMLQNHRPESQPVIVILTDGAANVGADGVQNSKDTSIGFNYAKEAAMFAKDNGIVFYTIALLGTNENPDTSEPNKLLKEMATTEQHHHFVLGSIGLEAIYQQIVNEIGRASAYDVTVTDIVSPEFEIVPGSTDQNIPKPGIDGNTLTWTFLELKDQTLTFKYKIRHRDGARVGTLPISMNSNITYLDYAGARLNPAIQSPYITVKHLAPVIDSIVSDNGNIAGGDTVTINGENFRQGLSVSFGSTAATNINFISDTQVTATVPAGFQGKTTVTLVNDDRQAATIDYRYWAQPVVSAVTPDVGYTTGGTNVRIDGKYFMPGIKVKFGNIPATSVSNGQTSINAVTPLVDKPGTVDIVVENEDGTSTTVQGGFTYVLPPSPVITSITPDNGPLEGGTAVEIVGSNLNGKTAVYFGDIEANGLYFFSSEKIRVFTPPATSAGAIAVKVVNEDGQYSVLDNGFTYNEAPKAPEPTITSITPNNGPIDTETKVTIKGTDFVAGVKVYFGDTLGGTIYYSSKSTISAYSPLATMPGAVDVKVVNPDDQEYTLTNGFTYTESPKALAPTITSVTPNTGYIDNSYNVYIEGSNFDRTAKVLFGTNEVGISSYFSSSRIRVIVPAASQAGAVDVTVINEDGQSATLTGGFTYTEPPEAPAPTITSVTPNTGYTNNSLIVYIEGSNFDRTAKVFIGTSELAINNYSSSSKIRVLVPATSQAGTVDVTVINEDGKSATLIGGFTFIEAPKIVPAITSITPNSGLVTGGEYVIIEGSNFQNGSKVYFGTIQGSINYFYSSEKIRVKTPAMMVAGAVDVKVVSEDGEEAIVQGGFTYQYLMPVVTAVSPTTGLTTGGYSVYISGTNFNSESKAYFDGVYAPMDSYLSSLKFRVTVPAHTAGTVDVTVENPDGSASKLEQGFTYTEPPMTAAPTITAITPNNGLIDAKTKVTITGSNIVSGAKVYFGDTLGTGSYYYSTSKMTVYSPILTTAGAVDVKIVNPDGQSVTLAGGFTYNP